MDQAKCLQQHIMTQDVPQHNYYVWVQKKYVKVLMGISLNTCMIQHVVWYDQYNNREGHFYDWSCNGIMHSNYLYDRPQGAKQYNSDMHYKYISIETRSI